MSFLLYVTGFLILIAGLVWAAATLGVPQTYIAIGAVILLGMGIMNVAANTRRRDPEEGCNVPATD